MDDGEQERDGALTAEEAEQLRADRRDAFKIYNRVLEDVARKQAEAVGNFATSAHLAGVSLQEAMAALQGFGHNYPEKFSAVVHNNYSARRLTQEEREDLAADFERATSAADSVFEDVECEREVRLDTIDLRKLYGI